MTFRDVGSDVIGVYLNADNRYMFSSRQAQDGQVILRGNDEIRWLQRVCKESP